MFECKPLKISSASYGDTETESNHLLIKKVGTFCISGDGLQSWIWKSKASILPTRPPSTH